MTDEQDHLALRSVAKVCADMNVDWMLIGALARDIQLVDTAGLAPGRATDDIDIAVLFRTWDEYENLRQRLIDSEGFVAGIVLHRLRGQPINNLTGRQLDIVPFGPVQSAGGANQATPVVRWPPDATVVMTVAGFDEALKSSIDFRIEDFSIKVASVPGLAILKLIAWLDRKEQTTKDAADLETILTNYEHVIDQARYYDDDSGVGEAFDHDVPTMCAWFLGADIQSIATPTTAALVTKALRSDIHLSMPGARRNADHLRKLLDVCATGLNKTR
jgi:predicted nucleotidyltransferase